MTDERVTQTTPEVIVSADASRSVTQTAVEVFESANIEFVVSQNTAEVLTGANYPLCVTQNCIEVLTKYVAPPTCYLTFPTTQYAPAAQYYVSLKNQSGTVVAIFDKWDNLQYTLALNDTGKFSFSLPGDDPRVSMFELDGQLEVWRSVPGVGVIWYKDFEGFHRKWDYSLDSGGEDKFVSSGFCYNDLLARTVIAYKAGTIRADKNDASETVMKEYVQENCGAGATNTVVGRMRTGALPGFTVEIDSGSGVTWAGSRTFENLLDVLKEIATYSGIDFKVGGTGPATFMFFTYPNMVGKDRTATNVDPTTGKNGSGEYPTIMSVRLGTAQDMEYTVDNMGESNVVFVLGEGDVSLRDVYTRADTNTTDDSPWNRMETSRPGGNQEFDYQYNQVGDDALMELAAKTTFSFTPNQTNQCAYGKHYFLGDRVTVDYKGVRVHKRIVKVSVKVAGGVESIEVELSDIKRDV